MPFYLTESVTTFEKGDVIYDVGGKDRTFFFLLSGLVKVGTITPDGHELIYDVRKGGDVVGELCASQRQRPDRVVALERTEAISVPYIEVMEVLRKQPNLLDRLMEVFCQALTEAYEQVNSLAVDDTIHRLVKVLLRLRRNWPSGRARGGDSDVFDARGDLPDGVSAPGKSFDGTQFPAPAGDGPLFEPRQPYLGHQGTRKLHRLNMIRFGPSIKCCPSQCYRSN